MSVVLGSYHALNKVVKQYIDDKIAEIGGAIRIKGSVQTYADLPTEDNAQIASQTPILSEKTWIEKAGIWCECQAILDSHLEDFRAWAQDLKAAIVVPEENVEVKEEQEEE